MQYYLDLFTPETWKAFDGHGRKISGFRERQQRTAERVEPGDIFLCYLAAGLCAGVKAQKGIEF